MNARAKLFSWSISRPRTITNIAGIPARDGDSPQRIRGDGIAPGKLKPGALGLRQGVERVRVERGRLDEVFRNITVGG